MLANGKSPGALTTATDITTLVPPEELLAWIDAEAAIHSWNHTNRSQGIPGGLELPYELMLRLVCFCYASGRYSTQEIIEASRSHPVLVTLSSGVSPFALEIVNFRRRNSNLIERILTAVLLRTLLTTTPLPAAAPATCYPHALECQAVERVSLARHMDYLED